MERKQRIIAKNIILFLLTTKIIMVDKSKTESRRKKLFYKKYKAIDNKNIFFIEDSVTYYVFCAHAKAGNPLIAKYPDHKFLAKFAEVPNYAN